MARVHTWRSFLNFLIGAVSQNLVTPISVSITCAAGDSDGEMNDDAAGAETAPAVVGRD